MRELMSLYKRNGLALVPQNRDYEAVFETPMRVVPLTEEIENDLLGSWVCFEE